MAKVTWRLATDPNDPIFNGGYVVSSHNRRIRERTDAAEKSIEETPPTKVIDSEDLDDEKK